MNTNPVKKLTMVSYSTGGHTFVQFVMALYDEKGKAHIASDFITNELDKRGLRRTQQCIVVR